METFLSVVFVNRVLSAITEKELSYKLINILLSVFLAYVLVRSLFFKEDNLIYYMSLYAIFVVVKMLAHIIVVAFARIRIGVLRKIIRKTYAAEILFGLVLLIGSFSFVFRAIDRVLTHT